MSETSGTSTSGATGATGAGTTVAANTGEAGDAGGVTRTYRAEVVGQFDRPTGGVRERLLAEQGDHDVFASAFTEAGCLTYGPTLTRFTVRYLLSVTAASSIAADADAATLAELATLELLEAGEVPHKDLTVSLTCLEDLKRRR